MRLHRRKSSTTQIWLAFAASHICAETKSRAGSFAQVLRETLAPSGKRMRTRRRPGRSRVVHSGRLTFDSRDARMQATATVRKLLRTEAIVKARTHGARSHRAAI